MRRESFHNARQILWMALTLALLPLCLSALADGLKYSSDDALQSSGVSGDWEYNVRTASFGEIYTEISAWHGSASELTDISDSLGGYSVRTLGNGLFAGHTELTRAVLPNTLRRIGDSAFEGCTNLSLVEGASPSSYVPKVMTEIESIGDRAFKGCVSLTAFPIPNSSVYQSNIDGSDITRYAVLTSIGDEAFSGAGIAGELVIPTSVTTMGAGAFEGCDGITALTFPSYTVTTVTSTSTSTKSYSPVLASVGSEAFRGCASLTEVTLPYSVTDVGEGAFRDCTSLTGLSASGLTALPAEMLRNTAIVSFEVGKSVTSIGADAFADCPALVRVDLPQNVDHTFPQGVSVIRFDPNYIWTVSGQMGKAVVSYAGSDESLTLGSDYMAIGPGAFADNTTLRHVDIASRNMKMICDHAFQNCTALESVNLPGSLVEIKEAAFQGCTALEAVVLPNVLSSYINDTYIPSVYGDALFEGCTSLTSVTITDNAKSIPEGMFRGCSSLESFQIPSTVTSIGEGAFEGCTSLGTVEYASTLADWNEIEISADNEPLTSAALYTTDPPTTGSCGEDAQWELRVTGRLSVTGSGEVTSAPWKDAGIAITALEISDDITMIPEGAFSDVVGANSGQGYVNARRWVRTPAGVLHVFGNGTMESMGSGHSS